MTSARVLIGGLGLLLVWATSAVCRAADVLLVPELFYRTVLLVGVLGLAVRIPPLDTTRRFAAESQRRIEGLGTVGWILLAGSLAIAMVPDLVRLGMVSRCFVVADLTLPAMAAGCFLVEGWSRAALPADLTLDEAASMLRATGATEPTLVEKLAVMTAHEQRVPEEFPRAMALPLIFVTGLSLAMTWSFLTLRGPVLTSFSRVVGQTRTEVASCLAWADMKRTPVMLHDLDRRDDAAWHPRRAYQSMATCRAAATLDRMGHRLECRPVWSVPGAWGLFYEDALERYDRQLEAPRDVAGARRELLPKRRHDLLGDRAQ